MFIRRLQDGDGFALLFVVIVNYGYRLVLASLLDFAVLLSTSRLGVLCFLLVVVVVVVLIVDLVRSSILVVFGTQLSLFLLALILVLVFAFGFGSALGLFLWRYRGKNKNSKKRVAEKGSRDHHGVTQDDLRGSSSSESAESKFEPSDSAYLDGWVSLAVGVGCARKENCFHELDKKCHDSHVKCRGKVGVS